MAKSVISIEGVTKEYNLGVINHRTLYRDIQSRLSRLLNKEDPNSLLGIDTRRTRGGKFHALDDVSLDIRQGEVVGILGKNGAGKSTLLKILSRVTGPTKGIVKIKGRIASLLEVGTGFHPELTGRENVFLNGAILGMRKREIQAKFDQIVDFSGIEEFIDTPVKRYSSGMYVRLAFSVAAHLEQEILIVDEVLAVGDVDFQKKCLGKMESVSRVGGRTVLFVSHNLGAIGSMCNRGIFFDQGKKVYDGSVEQSIKKYMQNDEKTGSRKIYDINVNSSKSFAALCEVYLKRYNDGYSTLFNSDEEIVIGLVYDQLVNATKSEFKPYPQINITNSRGDIAFASMPSGELLSEMAPGRYLAECRIPANFLNIGAYFLSVGMAHVEKGTNVAFLEESVLSFEIAEALSEGGKITRNGYTGPMPGVIRPLLDWKIIKT